MYETVPNSMFYGTIFKFLIKTRTVYVTQQKGALCPNFKH